MEMWNSDCSVCVPGSPTFTSKLITARLFGKSPLNAYLKLNKWIWQRLPASLVELPPVLRYGAFIQRLVQLRATRRQYFGTHFFRNRPQLRLLRRLSEEMGDGLSLKVAFLACSNGAELYSVLWTIRSARPDLNVASHAVDISPEILTVARKGVYSLRVPELVNATLFARMTCEEIRAMFDCREDEVSVKPWLKEGISWHLADARSPDLPDLLGPQDIVVANNFLCHMDSATARECLRNIARLVKPGGYLFVSGIDLDVRTAVARDLGLLPLVESIQEIHDGDPSLRNDWPWEYWGLEPFNRRRADWKLRYAAVFQSPK